VSPFTIGVDHAVLADLRRRILATRWPSVPAGPGWTAGSDIEFLRELARHWVTDFSWPAAVALLNAWPQVVTTIEGQRLHAIHARSPVPEAMPLLVTHGWPGSVFEFGKILGPLTDPAAFGADPADAFHVVCPSMPGYGWSGPTGEPGWDVTRVARAELELMRRLGYARFGAQGGDWGAFVAGRIAQAAPESVIGIHLNFLVAGPEDPTDPLAGLDRADRERVQSFLDYGRAESGYAMLQSTKPQTLAFGLSDSPVGLAAWIVEKFRAWSDCGGDVLRRFTMDELLANVTAYWVTGTAGSAARLYFETARSGGRGPMGGLGERITVPTGCAVFPAEIYHPPQSWVERQYQVERWTQFDRGGHFAAMEEPELLVADIRAFFRAARDTAGAQG
jgi:microsomal epoxide hydrolase